LGFKKGRIGASCNRNAYNFLRSMKRKRIIIMGYMGRTPIGGVIWQHLHYIVGLQRLGHQVYYVEDSTSYLFNPVSLQT
jgi:hypothetical protein